MGVFHSTSSLGKGTFPVCSWVPQHSPRVRDAPAPEHPRVSLLSPGSPPGQQGSAWSCRGLWAPPSPPRHHQLPALPGLCSISQHTGWDFWETPQHWQDMSCAALRQRCFEWEGFPKDWGLCLGLPVCPGQVCVTQSGHVCTYTDLCIYEVQLRQSH